MQPIAFGGNRNVARLQSVFGIPFILAGGTAGASTNQFTMGNNGAISTLPTLPATYAGAWIYMPANGIFAGSTAGWYWFVGSSATAGTVYNNTYTTGDPVAAIPTSPTAFVTTGPGVVTQSTSEIIAAEILIPAGAMGANGHLRYSTLFSHINNANNKTYRFRLGGTQGVGGTQLQGGNGTTSAGSGSVGSIANRNSASSQVALNGNSGLPGSGGQIGLSSINTGANAYFQVSMQLANTTDFIALEFQSLEILYRQ